MACPDASAAIHECVLAIKARRPGRRPGRDDPRLPVDVADPQRAVRRRPARARPARQRRRLTASRSNTTSPSIRTSVGRAVASAPPGSTGSSSAAAGRTTTSARWPTVEAAAIGLAAPRRPDRRTRRAAPGRGSAPRPARTAASRPASAGPRGGPPARCPGHGSNGSTGASVPNAMTAPVRASERPGVAVAPRRGRPTARRACGRVRAEVDRLDARGDARRREPRPVGRVEQLDVLDARHERQRRAGRAPGRRARPGRRRRRSRGSASRSRPRRPVAASSASSLGLGHPDAAPPLGRERPVRLRLDVARGGPPSASPSDPSAKQLLPADPGPAVGVVAERRRRCGARASIAASSASSRRQAWTRSGQAARVGEARDRPGTDQVRSGIRRERARDRGTATTPSATQLAADGARSPPRGPPASAAGRWTVTSRAAASCRTPSGSPSASRRMMPPGGSGVAAVDARRPRARRGSPSRAWWSCAQSATRRPGRDPLEVVGRRPATPAVRVPAVALEPRVRVAASRAWAARTAAIPSSSVAALEQVDLPAAQRRLGEVEMRVGQPGDRDLVRLEVRSARVCGSARVSRSTSEPGEGDPAVADPDRLDPAEARRRRRASRSDR